MDGAIPPSRVEKGEPEQEGRKRAGEGTRAPAAPEAAPGLKVAPPCQFKTCPGSANEPG